MDYNNDYLMHYGVQGMKWGKRKAKYEYKYAYGQKPKNAYQKVARSLGGTKLAKGAIKISGMSDAQKKNALKEHAILADEKAYNKAAKKAHKTGGKMTYDVATGKYSVDKPAKATNPNRSREIAIAATASIGTAMAAYGVYRVSKAIKDKSFNHSVSNGMRALEALESRGRFNDGLDDLKDIINRERSSSVASVIKRTIDNNSVNGRVDWANIKKIYM